MKNSLRLLSLVLLLTAGAWCQSASISGSLTASGSSCDSTNCVEFKPLQTNVSYGSVVITVSGTWTATLQFEASGDKGVTYVAINAFPLNSTTAATSATANGSWQRNVAGVTNIRVRCSAFTSGPIVVTIQTSTAPAPSGGGGGTGAVSSVTGAGTVSCSPTTGAVTCTGSGASAPGTTNDVPITGAGATFVADTGIFTYNPSTHILNAGQGITTGTGSGVATTLGLSGGTTPGSFPSNAFGWLGPNNATFTSYFLQCPTTPPTNGQTILFGTQVGSVVPCTYVTPSSAGGNHNIDLIGGAAQLTAGCSINNSFLTNTQVTCLFQAGSATAPQQAFPQFTVAGTLGTTVTSATALYIGPKTVPSDYTASGNLTIHFAVANPTVITGAETFSVRYAHATPPAVAQPTFVTTDYSTASLTVSGTVNNTVTGTATITSPSLTAGDQVWFVVYLSAKTATDNPYLTQLYMSY